MVTKNPFYSFWMAGYECSDQLNVHGNRVDFLRITSHLTRLADDYRLISDVGFRTVREGVRWSQVERAPYRYDFDDLERMLLCGHEKNVQQIWDLCHFGYPDDLTPLHPHFSERFSAFCKAFASFVSRMDLDFPLIVTPINEVSFLSWLGGDVAGTSPYCRNNGWEVKYALMRAYIQGIESLKSVNPDIRILTTEPLVNVVPPLGATSEQRAAAQHQHELQYQCLDILSGRSCPELGGKPEYLDIIGFNYYPYNQWVHEPYQPLAWRADQQHPAYKRLSQLLKEAYNRYERPFVLTETSHYGDNRPLWIEEIVNEIAELIRSNLPVWGICIYPILDRPDWDDLDHWHHSGLWDRVPETRDERVLHRPTAEAILNGQKIISDLLHTNPHAKTYENPPPTTARSKDTELYWHSFLSSFS